MEIYLIRHTKPLVAEGVCYGHTDLSLAPSFQEEWQVLNRKIPSHFDVVYTSPTQRCRQLADLFKSTKRETRLDLRELNFGDWEMKKWEEIDPETLEKWMSDFVHVATPNGESCHDLFERAAAFLNELYAASFNRVAVVAHAGTIRAMVAHVLGLAPDKSFSLEFGYGKVSLIEISGKLKKVKYLNL